MPRKFAYDRFAYDYYIVDIPRACGTTEERADLAILNARERASYVTPCDWTAWATDDSDLVKVRRRRHRTKPISQRRRPTVHQPALPTPTYHTLEEVQARYPRLIFWMKQAAILTSTEAAAGLRDYLNRHHHTGIEQWGGGEAVSHFGGPLKVIQAALRYRRACKGTIARERR